MFYSADGLKEKIRGIYPEIKEHDLALEASFNEEKNAWILELEKGKHKLTTHLEKKDADECMNNVKCIYLGVQIGQFVENFEEDEEGLAS
jgi:hypothetical protein